MHEHFRDVAAMRLVLRQVQEDLDGADDRSRRVFGGEHHALTARHARGCTAPERLRLRARHREHEADGRATFDAVDQDVAQALDLALADVLQASNPDGVRHAHLLEARERSVATITT